jgi:hypothetical protein
MQTHPLSRILATAALVAMPLACSRTPTTGAGQPASAAQATTDQAGERGAAAAPDAFRPQPPRALEVRVPAGTRLAVRLDSGLSSASAAPGEIVAGELAAPLDVDGRRVAGVGTPVEARVEAAVPSGRLARQARLVLTLSAITIGDRRLAITTDALARSGPSHRRRNERLIGGGAVVGAIVGQLLGGHTKSTLRGAAVGAAASTGVAAANGRLDVTIGTGQVLDFTLRDPLVVPR